MATFDPSVRRRRRDPQQGRLAAARRRGRASRSTCRCSASLPRDDGIAAPSRHLGLVPAAERDEAADALDRLADRIAETVDLDAVLALARTAPDLDDEPWTPGLVTVAARLLEASESLATPNRTRPPRPARRSAVAGGRAFTFRYAETAELLGRPAARSSPSTRRPTLRCPTARGPLPRRRVPRGARRGAQRQRLAARREMRAAVLDGVPTVAECAGLLYLCRTPRRRPDGRRPRGGRGDDASS